MEGPSATSAVKFSEVSLAGQAHRENDESQTGRGRAGGFKESKVPILPRLDTCTSASVQNRRVSIVTAEGQTTIPAERRRELGIKPGDQIAFSIEEAISRQRTALTPTDEAFLVTKE
jgi:AbrB family looped-hinge helix DNA binding protein